MATYKLRLYTEPPTKDVTIRSPHDFNIEKYTITKAGRMSDGKMTMEYIARKHKFVFSYQVISSKYKEKIDDILFGNHGEMFFILTYTEDGTSKTCQVYPGAIKGKKLREGKIWYWKDYSFDLIEV
jgi:hypothetical protein